MSKTKTTSWVNYVGDEKPIYATPGSAACDLKSVEDVNIPSGEWRGISTGIKIQMPDNILAMVCPRSGLALKHGLTVLNGPGIVDPDFTGLIKVILMNHSKQDYFVSKGDRIAQLVFLPSLQATLLNVAAISDTERGEGGFGSTGK